MPLQVPSTSATPTVTCNKTVNRKSRVPALSETDTSDLEGTPNPTKNTNLPDQSLSLDNDQLETHDRMSKEKQKFFRSSAFNSEKNKDKKSQSNKNNTDKSNLDTDETDSTAKSSVGKLESDRRITRTSQESTGTKKVVRKSRSDKTNIDENAKELQTTKIQPKRAVNKSQNTNKIPIKEAKQVQSDKVEEQMEIQKEKDEAENETEGTSSDDSSFSTCSSDSETDSSVDKLDLRITMRNIQIPPLFSAGTDNKEAFGGKVDNNSPWSIATAAEAKKKDFLAFGSSSKSSENLFINALREEGLLKNYTENSQEDDKTSQAEKNQKAPGYGQLKGLFDGLSHLFTAPSESRASRSQPNYNPNRRKPKDAKEETKEEEDKEEKPIKLEQKPKIETIVKTIPDSQPQSKASPARSSPFPSLPKNEIVSPATMTPSGLVKTAVNSKQHERRKLIKSEDVQATTASNQKSNVEVVDARSVKKRNAIAGQATTTANQFTVQPFINNQTGKIGSPHAFVHFTVPFIFTHLSISKFHHTRLFVCLK